jgi:long-chain acyl-CoA synthetase
MNIVTDIPHFPSLRFSALEHGHGLALVAAAIPAVGAFRRGRLPGVQSNRTDEKKMPRENLQSLFAEFSRYASDTAITQSQGYRRESWTYAKLQRQSINFAIRLKEKQITTGDPVLLWGPNSAEWLAAFWAILLRGAVAVPMDEMATPEFAAKVATQAGVKLIIKSANHPHWDAQIPTIDMSALSGTAHRNHALPPYAYLSDEPITRQHLAQILFTSGTTSEPKGVLLTHGNFLANLEPLEKGIAPYRKYERWLHPLRFVSLVPLSHVFGQFMTLLVPPLLGATVIFEPSTSPRDILHTIKKERATALVAVPRILDLLRNHLEQNAPGDFSKLFQRAAQEKFLRRAWLFRKMHNKFGWKFWAFISGGASLPRDTEDFLRRLGYAVVQGYGMTETASLISLNHPFRATQGSIGKILPGRQCKLAEDGEILVRGESVSSGYWQNPAVKGRASKSSPDNPPSEPAGWLRTGDLGELDPAGNLRFRGRKKNVMVSGSGLNLYPEDLEAALHRQPQIRDAVVFPLGGNNSAAVPLRDSAEPAAALLLNPTAADPKEIAAQAIHAANATLADYQQIRTWLVWPDPDFPRTATGKARLSQIAERATQMLTSAPGTPISRLAPLPIDALTQLLSRFTMAPHSNLEENLNLSSLDRVELLANLESTFHVELNDSALSQIKTISDIQKLITQPSAPRTEYSYPQWAQTKAIRALRLLMYYALVWPATKILGHPKIIGTENLKNLKPPALIVANHITRRADMGLLLYALPKKIRHNLATAMAGETLEQMRTPPLAWFPVKRWFYRMNYWLVTALFNVFPLPQFSGFRDSFKFAGESADRGYSLLIFPEGEVNRTPDGRMARFQPGIGLLAQNLHLPIIPMRLDGVAQMKQAGRRLARPGELTVTIGTPLTFPNETPPEEITRQLEAMVRSLR